MSDTQKVAHTPGPWHVTDNSHPRSIGFVYAPDGYLVADAMSQRHPIEANARLIAAPPDLLAALEKLVFLHACEQEGIEQGRPAPEQWIEAVDEATAAIQKATADHA